MMEVGSQEVVNAVPVFMMTVSSSPHELCFGLCPSSSPPASVSSVPIICSQCENNVIV